VTPPLLHSALGILHDKISGELSKRGGKGTGEKGGRKGGGDRKHRKLYIQASEKKKMGLIIFMNEKESTAEGAKKKGGWGKRPGGAGFQEFF